MVVAEAPIQAKHKETDLIARTPSATDGRYSLGALPAGRYELSITMPWCAYKPFAKTDITLRAGQSLGFEGPGGAV